MLPLVTALALWAMSGQTAPLRAAPELLPRLAFEVLNQKRTERRIVHLEDEIGPSARPRRNERLARAMLISAVGLDEPKTLEVLEAIDRLDRPLGGRVLALVQIQKDAQRAQAKQTYSGSTQGFVIALDTYGLTKTLLGLLSPGYHVVVQSDGRIVGSFGPREGLEAARAAFERILKEDAL